MSRSTQRFTTEEFTFPSGITWPKNTAVDLFDDYITDPNSSERYVSVARMDSGATSEVPVRILRHQPIPSN